ncbi:MAG: hypothetical protein J7K30_01390 [Deltaproteobacteria bacterium]|nr:hypothetical protein [Deltaproteobacteria bacterium]
MGFCRNRFPERLGLSFAKDLHTLLLPALIPNHFYPLLKTGKEPIAQIILRLLTGGITVTAVYFKIATPVK